ncbi:hypothetical protein CPB83DRAFT_834027 [Crepidotus variabilis]|uniref:Uncharacterized protein n=1 Tax=Crepidotus variabilis TaxID=179855 RepID=A0A9P6JSZ5_9AGAR|nr:hypothetical protein CPB83DRAFT_834027 [Crepidotus variabilis]
MAVKFDYFIPNIPTSLFDNLLAVSSDTLQTLNIHFSESGSTFEICPHSLQPLTALRTLRYTVDSRWPSHGDDIELETDSPEPRLILEGTRDVVHSLRTILREPTTLTLIEVIFRISMRYSAGVGFKSEAEWLELGDILTDVRFSSVSKIEVVVEMVLATPDVDLKKITFLERFPRRWNESYPSIPLRICNIEEYLEETS